MGPVDWGERGTSWWSGQIISVEGFRSVDCEGTNWLGGGNPSPSALGNLLGLGGWISHYIPPIGSVLVYSNYKSWSGWIYQTWLCTRSPDGDNKPLQCSTGRIQGHQYYSFYHHLEGRIGFNTVNPISCLQGRIIPCTPWWWIEWPYSTKTRELLGNPPPLPSRFP